MFHFQQLELLSPDAVRPFDRERKGTVFGEGAAAVILEKAADAKSRGAENLGEFLGSGGATEATGVLGLRSDGDGLARAIELSLADAEISPSEVGLIVAHGNGTPASDASEAAAIRRGFGAAKSFARLTAPLAGGDDGKNWSAGLLEFTL